ncbi:tetratricopeptide repeat protein [Granulicella sp. L60]|uniref:tetratricopeptide repeat protein n=1 Tax=Granulicella sp. L60 TaxID=1641866 RepID=UPI0020B13512|nr:tetratricopeptide repeat protein [Granulicella sp. L60]
MLSLHTLRRILPTLLLLCTPFAHSQSAPSADTGGRVVLVLPFDNRSGQSNLGWIGDSFPDTLNQRLTSSGFLTITRDDRQYALDHLGLPIDFRPSRATTIRIAQTLDADFVIVGSYTIENDHIAAQAQVLEVNKLKLSEALVDSSPLARLFDLENAIAWKVARQIDPHFNIAQQTFLSSSEGIRLSAFENYIRGTDATTAQERIKRLQQAVQENPNYPAALLALGKAQFAQRDYDQAATTLAKIQRSDRRALEAGFYIGLARFNSGKYAEAESAFAFVASRLPLPEVVNNQAVASSRQGHDAVPLFQRASTADPSDVDYHYNVAVALLRRGDFAGAQREVDQTLKLRPTDTEATQLKAMISAGRALPAAAKVASSTDTVPSFDPLERIRRTYSESSFRQAAFQLDQMRAARMATLPPAEQAAQYAQLGHDYLAQGLIPEAEHEFQTAISADSSSAAAHAGLAQVREHSGDSADARAEAQTAIRLHPSTDAYLVLARLDLQANQLESSASDVKKALQIDPKDSAALGMKQALQTRGQALP